VPVDISESAGLVNIDAFNEGNAIKAFFGDRGFLVFDPDIDLLGALILHMEKTEVESCGKCTPCRMGSKLIVDRLKRLARGEGDDKAWREVRELAEQMRVASLCGVGLTGATALIGALDHFGEKLREDANSGESRAQHGLSYMTAPCIEACPSKVNVPRYISYIRDGKPTHSLGVILQKYPMAATCGRVCVRFCEIACRRNLVDAAVGIKTLKRYVADRQTTERSVMFTKSMCAEPKDEKLRIAVVGAGPGGVACAYHLLLRGYPVDVFESTGEAGGMAARGIPSYRLPKDVLKSETDIVTALGGHFLFNKTMGQDFSIDDLFKDGYKAVYVSIGCAKGALLGAAGEDPSLAGYESGIDFLLRVHRHVDGLEKVDYDGKIVAVVGGGNVAMDCVRSALRLGAREVHLIYRRTEKDMPADPAEVEAAHHEGIHFHPLTNPKAILSDAGAVVGIELVDMQQTEPDKSGRRGVTPVEGSENVFPCDVVIAAIGQQIDHRAIRPDDGIKLDRWGNVDVDPLTQSTSRHGVFAGGDCALGPSTLIHAMANGLNAACSIDDYLRFGKVRFSPINRMRQILSENALLASDCIETPVKSLFRVHHPELDPDVRRAMFEEVEKGISTEAAYRESLRCMRCYRVYTVITDMPIQGGTCH
jgi:formate dehydrogenase beta subunit